jgi:hypothetical protein
MRKRLSPQESIHWEELIRTIIDQIGPEELAEVIEYVLAEMRAEARRLQNFAAETRRAEH